MSEERDMAELAGAANSRLGQAFNVVRFVYWAGSVATVSIVTSTIFLIRASDAIARHDKSIKLMWVKVFGFELP